MLVLSQVDQLCEELLQRGLFTTVPLSMAVDTLIALSGHSAAGEYIHLQSLPILHSELELFTVFTVVITYI